MLLFYTFKPNLRVLQRFLGSGINIYLKNVVFARDLTLTMQYRSEFPGGVGR